MASPARRFRRRRIVRRPRRVSAAALAFAIGACTPAAVRATSADGLIVRQKPLLQQVKRSLIVPAPAILRQKPLAVLPGLIPLVSPVSGVAVTITFIGRTTITGAATTFTFNSVNIGSPTADRVVVVSAGGEADPGRTITGVTVGGSSATKNCEAYDSGSGAIPGVGIFSYALASGATANIVVSTSANYQDMTIDVFSMTGNGGSTTAHDTGSHSDADPLTDAGFVIPAGGGAVGRAAVQDGSGAFSWSTLVEDTDAVIQSRHAQSSAHLNSAGGATGVTADQSTTGNAAGCWASWGAA